MFYMKGLSKTLNPLPVGYIYRVNCINIRKGMMLMKGKHFKDWQIFTDNTGQDMSNKNDDRI